MEVQVHWKRGMSFSGIADSEFEIDLGAKKSIGGDEDGNSPMELIALGLAGCTAMDVISILQKKRQDVRAFEVKTKMKRATDHPKVFTSAVIEYHLVGHDISEKAVIRSIDLSAQRYCPAQNMLSQIFPIDLEYFIYEGDKKIRKLLISGIHKIDV